MGGIETKRVGGSKTKLIVDCFDAKLLKENGLKTPSAFFLSHFHADHYGKLSSKFEFLGVAPIYCSPLTAALVIQQLGVAEQHVKILPFHKPSWIMEEPNWRVTLLDANHCPGASMLLFENSDTRQAFLHCGDMRYHSKFQRYQELQGITLDAVYLDTTYCHPKYKFPNQEDAIKMCEDIVAKHRGQSSIQEANTNKTLFLIQTYNIGKEKILFHLASKFNIKFAVTASRKRILDLVERDMNLQDSVFTLDTSVTDFRVVPWETFTNSVPWGYQPKWDSLRTYLEFENRKGKEYTHVVGIVPTGWCWNVKTQVSETSMDHGQLKVYGVPYSEHSSFTDLTDWVSFLRPKRIEPTVGGKTEAEKLRMVSYFSSHINKQGATSDFINGWNTKGIKKRKLEQEDESGVEAASSHPREFRKSQALPSPASHSENNTSNVMKKTSNTKLETKPKQRLISSYFQVEPRK
eukprot:CAMPEP_0184696208 /NCGR_PEP_ID=MMETSP0313-20130426/3573_1 /TAXON_ID=2792 /ORGANISM="Porphyridium aerugineum, Strain SAG 1380-2" /LENGTH=462 /DNA_ID=CAMNT_0027154785 /DNA_START=306 /DNA_END=1694 /DNA_ORIENTATION=+